MSGGHEEKRPRDHWFVWLPSRGQNTEDFQLLLGLKLTRRKRKKGPWAGDMMAPWLRERVLSGKSSELTNLGSQELRD